MTAIDDPEDPERKYSVHCGRIEQIEVHKHLGHGLLESIHKEALCLKKPT